MPTPYKTKQGQTFWRARWRSGKGERHSHSGFRTAEEACAYEERMRTARREGRHVRPARTRLTVERYWKTWWATEVAVGKTRATQYSYRGTYAAYIEPPLGSVTLSRLVEDPQLLVSWRQKLIKDKSPRAVGQAHRVLSSMLSAAAEEEIIPHNPLLLLSTRLRRRGRRIARIQASSPPVAVDLAAWFLVLDYLRRPTRPPVKGDKPRTRRFALDRERDALIVALGFMAGFRLPSEALGLTVGDARDGRLYMEGRSSAGEYLPGSKTGPGRDLPLRSELQETFEHVRQAHHDAGIQLRSSDFWIASRSDGGVWTEHQAHSWREREFRPVVRQVAADFPQLSALATVTPYKTRHTFISCCLQAGISLAVIAAWCGTSIEMISRTYGRMILRYEGSPAVALDDQFQAAKVHAVNLLSAPKPSASATTQSGSTPAGGSTHGSTAPAMPTPTQRHKGGFAGILPT